MNYFQLFKTYPKPIFFGLIVGFFSFAGQTHWIALFSPFLRDQFALSNTEYGSLYAGATLASGLLLPFIGPWIDKKDIRYFAFAVGSGLIFSLWLFAFSNTLLLLFISLFGLRLFGQGLCSHITAVGTARYFTVNRGKALALAFLGFSLSEGTVTPLMAQLLQSLPWTTIVLGVSLVLILVFLPATLFLTQGDANYNLPPTLETESSTPKSVAPTKVEQQQWTRKQVFTHPTIYILLLLALIPPYALTGVFFHQTVMGEMKRWTMVTMASGFFFFALMRFGCGFIGGPLVDRFKAKSVFPWTSLPLALGFFILAYFQSPWTPHVAFACFGASVGIGSTVKSSLWPELYGIDHLGAIKSTISTLMVISTAASPIAFGWILDTWGQVEPLLYALGTVTLLFSLLAYSHIRWGKKFPQN